MLVHRFLHSGYYTVSKCMKILAIGAVIAVFCCLMADSKSMASEASAVSDSKSVEVEVLHSVSGPGVVANSSAVLLDSAVISTTVSSALVGIVGNTLSSIFIILRLILVDIFLLLPRPIVVMNYYFLELEILTALYGDSLVVGLTATVCCCIFLACYGLGCLPKRGEEAFLMVSSIPIFSFYMLDGISEVIRVLGYSSLYPLSHSGCFTLSKICFSAIGLNEVIRVVVLGKELMHFRDYSDSLSLSWAIAYFSATYFLHFMSKFRLVGFFSIALSILKYAPLAHFFYSILPYRFQGNLILPLVMMLSVVRYFIKSAIGIARFLFQKFYDGVNLTWTYISNIYSNVVDLLWLFINTDIIIAIQRWVIDPMWRFFSPWTLPIISGFICTRFYRAQMILLESPLSLSSHLNFNNLLVFLCRVYIIFATATSSLILTFHAMSRGLQVVGFSSIEPLHNRTMCRLFDYGLRILTAPLRLKRILELYVIGVLWEGICMIGNFIFAPIACVVSLMFHNLLIGIFSSLGICFYTFKLYNSSNGFDFSWMLLFCGKAGEYLLQMYNTPIDSIADGTFVLLLITAVQHLVYSYCDAKIGFACRKFHMNEIDFDADIGNLNAIAATMTDPRQCGFCGLGPVDHAGCSNLRAHHGQSRGNQSRYSNSCPRCDWFVDSVDKWPYWDGESRTLYRDSRKTKWSEFVIYVRSGSKILSISYLLLAAGKYLNLPNALTLLLPVAYTIPWLSNLDSTCLMMQNTYSLRHTFPRRNLQNLNGQQQNHSNDNDTDCHANTNAARNRSGTSRGNRNANAGTTTENELISEADALANLLAAAPSLVYLVAKEECSICRDEFSDQAVDVSTRPNAATQLRSIDPPIVALRCGHVLHVDCAVGLVKAGASHHVRCPLCREPVTLRGAMVARLFS